MSFELISKHRGKIMAVAMLWLAIYHSYFPIKFKPISFVLVSCGYVGVDIFVFLSSFGLYFAYQKEHNYLKFIKRRVLKILPYAFFIYFFQMLFYDYSIKGTILDCLGLTIFFKSNFTNWFTSFILIAYLLTPIYLKIFIKRPTITTLIGVLIPVFMCVIVNKFEFTYIYLRFSIFCLGFPFAYALDKKIKIDKIIYYLIIIFMIFGWALMYYLYHYCGNDRIYIFPTLFMTPGNVLLIAAIINKFKFLWKTFDFLGHFTYQFHLIHLEVIKILYQNYGLLYIQGIGFDWWINIVGIVLAIIISVIYKGIIDFILNKLTKKPCNESKLCI